MRSKLGRSSVVETSSLSESEESFSLTIKCSINFRLQVSFLRRLRRQCSVSNFFGACFQVAVAPADVPMLSDDVPGRVCAAIDGPSWRGFVLQVVGKHATFGQGRPADESREEQLSTPSKGRVESRQNRTAEPTPASGLYRMGWHGERWRPRYFHKLLSLTVCAHHFARFVFYSIERTKRCARF